MCNCGQSDCHFCFQSIDFSAYVVYHIVGTMEGLDVGEHAVACLIQEEYAVL